MSDAIPSRAATKQRIYNATRELLDGRDATRLDGQRVWVSFQDAEDFRRFVEETGDLASLNPLVRGNTRSLVRNYIISRSHDERL
jgi:hypothetical protein